MHTIANLWPLTTLRLFRRLAIVSLAAALLSAGCGDQRAFQVVLAVSESMDVGNPVFLDDLQVGTVAYVGEEGGERVANLQVDMAAAGDKIREGIVRVPVPGRIQLKSDAVKADAPKLAKGARIPTRSGLLATVMSYSNGSTLMAAAVAVVALVVLYLVFRSLLGAIGLIICSALAAILTQTVYLHLAPWVLRVYERFPPAEVGGGSTPGAVPAAATSGMVGQAMVTINEVMSARPDPRMVAWCLVFLATFIVLNIVLGRVSRVWRR